MKENKIAFISCSNQREIREEIIKYIEKLKLPIGIERELIIIDDALSMTEGYNRAMSRSDAKYKIYMHHDVFIINPLLIEESIRIFSENPHIGILGVIGCEKLPRNGIWWESDSCIGKTLEDNLECLKLLELGEVKEPYCEVQALDGQFLMTQYDIMWREDICRGWHFYDTSQCLEFARAGYIAAVVRQESPWLIHECGMDINRGYEEERDRFLNEYRLQIENRDFSVEERIGLLINTGALQEAKSLLEEYKEKVFYNDNMAIFEASLLFAEQKEYEAYCCIGKGLSYNCRNYELYFMLGNYYREKNKNQAFLCYENSEFFCNNEDKEYVRSVKDELLLSGEIEVRPVSVIILSYNGMELTSLCIDSLCQSMPKEAGELVIIDNASTDGSAIWLQNLKKSEETKNNSTRRNPVIKVICNEENKGFPSGCNQGILAAEPENDIFLLNNDTIVPPNALFWLRMGLYENEKIGAAGSVSNHANNDQMVTAKKGSPEAWYKYGEEHNIPMKYPYEKKAWLMGFAVMFKRKALEKVGYLDERFTPGNYEDNDIGYRFLKEGYTQLLCKNSFIYHFGSVGFRKNKRAFDELLSSNRKKLIEKHGMEIDSFSWVRTDLLKLIEEEPFSRLRILDVGCGLGATIAKAESLFPNSEVIGIEKEPEVVRIGNNLARIIKGDIETMELPFEESRFDYILLGNVLEHLKNPPEVLKRLYRYVKKPGSIIISFSKHYRKNGVMRTVKKEELEKMLPNNKELKVIWIKEEVNEEKPDYIIKVQLINSK